MLPSHPLPPATASWVRGVIMGIAGERVVARLRNELYSAILHQDIAFFDARKTGELVSRLGSDTTSVQMATSRALPEAAIGAIKVIVSITLMITISAKLTAIVFTVAMMISIMCVVSRGSCHLDLPTSTPWSLLTSSPPHSSPLPLLTPHFHPSSPPLNSPTLIHQPTPAVRHLVCQDRQGLPGCPRACTDLVY